MKFSIFPYWRRILFSSFLSKNESTTAQKVSKYEVFSGQYFPILELNAKVDSVNLRIQSNYGKTRTRKNSIFEHFSHSVL